RLSQVFGEFIELVVHAFSFRFGCCYDFRLSFLLVLSGVGRSATPCECTGSLVFFVIHQRDGSFDRKETRVALGTALQQQDSGCARKVSMPPDHCERAMKLRAAGCIERCAAQSHLCGEYIALRVLEHPMRSPVVRVHRQVNCLVGGRRRGSAEMREVTRCRDEEVQKWLKGSRRKRREWWKHLNRRVEIASKR